jgi:ribulose kinase
MPDNLYGGLDFGTSGARISIINLRKEIVYANSVPYLSSFA